MELYIIVSIVSLSLLSFLDIIVYNEEILLTVCFFCFLFYCFNSLSKSVESSFEARAAKFEQDLLSSYGLLQSTLVTDFNLFSKTQRFIDQYTITFSCFNFFLSSCFTYIQKKPMWSYHQACMLKLNELTLISKHHISEVQKMSVIHLVYSLIINNTTVKSINIGVSVKYSSSELKNLCIL